MASDDIFREDLNSLHEGDLDSVVDGYFSFINDHSDSNLEWESEDFNAGILRHGTSPSPSPPSMETPPVEGEPDKIEVDDVLDDHFSFLHSEDSTADELDDFQIETSNSKSNNQFISDSHLGESSDLESSYTNTVLNNFEISNSLSPSDEIFENSENFGQSEIYSENISDNGAISIKSQETVQKALNSEESNSYYHNNNDNTAVIKIPVGSPSKPPTRDRKSSVYLNGDDMEMEANNYASGFVDPYVGHEIPSSSSIFASAANIDHEKQNKKNLSDELSLHNSFDGAVSQPVSSGNISLIKERDFENTRMQNNSVPELDRCKARVGVGARAKEDATETNLKVDDTLERVSFVRKSNEMDNDDWCESVASHSESDTPEQIDDNLERKFCNNDHKEKSLSHKSQSYPLNECKNNSRTIEEWEEKVSSTGKGNELFKSFENREDSVSPKAVYLDSNFQREQVSSPNRTRRNYNYDDSIVPKSSFKGNLDNIKHDDDFKESNSLFNFQMENNQSSDNSLRSLCSSINSDNLSKSGKGKDLYCNQGVSHDSILDNLLDSPSPDLKKYIDKLHSFDLEIEQLESLDHTRTVFDLHSLSSSDPIAEAINSDIVSTDSSSILTFPSYLTLNTDLDSPVASQQDIIDFVSINEDKPLGAPVQSNIVNERACRNESVREPTQNPYNDNLTNFTIESGSTFPDERPSSASVSTGLSGVIRRSMRRMKHIRLSGRKSKRKSKVSEETEVRRQVPAAPELGLPSVRSPSSSAILIPTLLAALAPNDPPRESLPSPDNVLGSSYR